MYKCGWNGCEKAYGTLNHLNAHVTMQAHGTKRTPEGKANPIRSFSGHMMSLIYQCVSSRVNSSFFLVGGSLL